MRGSKKKNHSKPWTAQDIEKLRKLYHKHSAEDLVATFERSAAAIASAAKRYDIRSGRAPRFTLGNIPHNKGKKQSEYMSSEAIQKTKATRFKKGSIPYNTKPLGYERITVDGYIEVKTAEPNVFRLKHRVVFEKHYGKIPPGHNVQFKDGNRQNLNPDNLYSISRKDQLKYQNSIHNYPEEIRKAILQVGALNRQINKRTKKTKQ